MKEKLGRNKSKEFKESSEGMSLKQRLYELQDKTFEEHEQIAIDNAIRSIPRKKYQSRVA